MKQYKVEYTCDDAEQHTVGFGHFEIWDAETIEAESPEQAVWLLKDSWRDSAIDTGGFDVAELVELMENYENRYLYRVVEDGTVIYSE